MSVKNLNNHLTVFKQFLEISGDARGTRSRNKTRAADARGKLLRLSNNQFKELSTDVYDELRRRIDESRGEPDHLLPKSAYHPSRNDARKKLSTLAQHRFKDLVSDISFEIERRGLQNSEEYVTTKSPTDTKSVNSVPGPVLSTGSQSQVSEKQVTDPEEESNVSKASVSSEVANQTIGVSSKTVVPTKANLTWSSDEEEEEEVELRDATTPEDLNDINEDEFKGVKQLGTGLNTAIGAPADFSASKGTRELQDDSKDQEIQSLKAKLDELQKQHKEVLDKNFSLTKEKSLFDNERSEWEQTKSEFQNRLLNLQDNADYKQLTQEFEKVKSTNAALRLENQSLKNSVNASTKDHTRSSSMNTLSKDFSSTVDPQGDKSKEGLNQQMKTILDKLSNLDAPAKKPPTHQSLRDETLIWQKKYEDLRAEKLNKDFNTSLLDQDHLKSFVSDQGLISLDSVTRLHSLIEVFMSFIDQKSFDSELLFEKVSTLSLVSNDIANQGDKDHLNSNDLSIQVRDAASHLLTVVRHFTVFPNLLPKVLVERSVSGLVFSICDLIGICKLTNDDSISMQFNKSATPVSQSNTSDRGITNVNDDPSTEVGVRPLRMANRLKDNNSESSLASSQVSRDVSPSNQPRKFNALALKLGKSTDSLSTIGNTSNGQIGNTSNGQIANDDFGTTPTKKVNTFSSKSGKQTDSLSNIDNTSHGQIVNDDVRTTPSKKSSVLNRVKQFESPPPTTPFNKKRGSFSPPGSENESTSNSFILNRSSLEMKKSPRDIVQKFESKSKELNGAADLSVNSIKSESSNIATPVATSVFGDDNAQLNSKQGDTDEAFARSNSRGKGIFQSIRDRFANTSKEEPVIETKQDSSNHDSSSENIQTSTAETTPSKGSTSDLEISPNPNKSFQSVRSRFMDEDDDETRAPSSAASDGTIALEDQEPVIRKVQLTKPESSALKSAEIPPVQRVQKKKVTIDQPERAREERKEEDNDEDNDEDNEKTFQAKQRQEYRKSMAAASFNVDLFDIDDPDNTLTQVLLYLEHQTVEVINTIQVLLTAIRKPNATRGELSQKSRAVTEVIKQMTEATNTSMNQTRNAQLKEHGSWIVNSLEDCFHRMNILSKPSNDEKRDSEFADKSLKQRLAGNCHDIVRCTKELVKTVEEASLKEDIANLDARLRHSHDLA